MKIKDCFNSEQSKNKVKKKRKVRNKKVDVDCIIDNDIIEDGIVKLVLNNNDKGEIDYED